MQMQTSQKRSFISFSPVGESLRVVVPYFIIGCLWIFFSDSLLSPGDARDVLLFSILKGWGYVLFTSVLLWILIYTRVKRARAGEQALEKSKIHFKLLLDNIPESVMLHTDNRLVYVNAGALKLLGIDKAEEIIGQDPLSVILPDKRTHSFEQMRRVVETPNGRRTWESVIQRRNGEQVEVEMAAVPFYANGCNSVITFVRDISERNRFERERMRLELQMRQKHRLEAVGILAGGIAHEINNPITGIINYAELIGDSPFADEQLREYSREIVREGLRVAETVRNLLSFSQYEKKHYRQVAVSRIVEETLSLTREALRHDRADLIVNVAQDLPMARWCTQQIKQLLMNLITNAREALNARYPKGHDNKRLIITAERAARKDRSWVRFAVEDRGAGIPAELLPKVFDPFFTTATRSEHTGLGLSIGLSVVKEHQGDIWFESQVGEYTRAIVELPAEPEL